MAEPTSLVPILCLVFGELAFHNFRSHLHVPVPVSHLAPSPQTPASNILLQSTSREHVHSLVNVFGFHPHLKKTGPIGGNDRVLQNPTSNRCCCGTTAEAFDAETTPLVR
jgi:hypothetical protein